MNVPEASHSVRALARSEGKWFTAVYPIYFWGSRRSRWGRRTTHTRPDFPRIPFGKPMTVALYEGYNAKEKWKRDLSRHLNVRHPNILQIYATASASGIYATVSHGDLVPFDQRTLDAMSWKRPITAV
ncbi:hypothetical protein MSAN_01606300 [Mycena sanguinolenta]|uniref:Uncharacterized protein n=1 Tax=Mycena sanguinolenta TaxID=230812 RepID=A0A8H7CXM7_9AGAR|nr:hypothetical protein MSAN_01606300 [Mycena sanguinolenta]